MGIMRFFVLASALVAAAYAEADASVVYGAYGYAGLPVVYGKSAPCVNAANLPVPCADGYAAGVHVIGKRDADADASVLYGAYGYGAHAVAATPFGLTHASNVGLCTNYLGVQVPC